MSEYQWAATIFSLCYILLAVRNKPLCFVFGLIASIIWAYEDFVNINLKFDGFLQIFYAVTSILGLYIWYKGKGTDDPVGIKKLSTTQHILFISIGTIVSLLAARIGLYYFETSLPYLDALTTGFSIMCTFLLVWRYLDNWLYWVVIDLCYIYIYGKQGAWLFVGIMIVYTIMAILGYKTWKTIEGKETMA